MGQGVLMRPGFAREAGRLTCDGVSLDAIAAAAGTPVYVYSAASIRDQYERLTHALAGAPHRIHYSVKANANLSVLRLLRAMGAGVDIVSGGELHRALLAGFTGRDIVFSGVGKTERELREALAARILMVNVESVGELELLDRVAGDLGVTAPVALRVNPEVNVDTPHHYTRTGERGLKFGIPYSEAGDTVRLAESLRHLHLLGLDMHIGSQVEHMESYEQAVARLLALFAELRRDGVGSIEYLDVGGGLAVPYDSEPPFDLEAFAASVVPASVRSGLRLIVEPGRFLVANAGVLLTRVLYRKRTGGREYVITDAGMNDFLRPSHYNAYHRIEAVADRPGRVVADIVGPVCESGDFFALDREVSDVQPGDLVAILSAGAYGFAMASTYNARPRPAEVLVDGGRFAVVTRREDYADLVRQEASEPRWSTD